MVVETSGLVTGVLFGILLQKGRVTVAPVGEGQRDALAGLLWSPEFTQ